MGAVNVGGMCQDGSSYPACIFYRWIWDRWGRLSDSCTYCIIVLYLQLSTVHVFSARQATAAWANITNYIGLSRHYKRISHRVK